MTTHRPFPGFDAVFQLRQPAGTADFHVIDGSPRAHREPDVRRGHVPAEPVELHYHFGRERPGDLVWEQHWQLLVSDRVVECFQERGFTGWSTYPVRVFGRDGEPLEGFNGLAITGTCGFIDYRLSDDTIKEFYGRQVRTFIGKYFDPGSWDGFDLFMPLVSEQRLMLAPVRDALLQFDLVGSTFVALSEHETLPAIVRSHHRWLRKAGVDLEPFDV